MVFQTIPKVIEYSICFPCNLLTSPIGRLNDLWRYRVNNTWTWISGSNTVNQSGIYDQDGKSTPSYAPGARNGAVGWYDYSSKEFWLFGGQGYDTNASNTGT